jgi:hypothetical protein
MSKYGIARAAQALAPRVALFFIKLPEYIPSKFCGSLFCGSAVLNNRVLIF